MRLKIEVISDIIRRFRKKFDLTNKNALYLGDDLTDEQIEDMISQADGNADGEVDFEEFKKMMDGM